MSRNKAYHKWRSEKSTRTLEEEVSWNEGFEAAIEMWMRESWEIEQILGRALGYPWYKDDQKNFPGATEKDGVCVGDHAAITLVMEAARKLGYTGGYIDKDY